MRSSLTLCLAICLVAAARHNQTGVYYQWPSLPPPPDRTIERVAIGLLLFGYGIAAAAWLMSLLGPHVALAYLFPLLLHLLHALADCYDPHESRKPDTLVCATIGSTSRDPTVVIVSVYAITVLAAITTLFIARSTATASYGSMLYTYALVAAVLGMSYEMGSPSPMGLVVGVSLLGPFMLFPMVFYYFAVTLLGKAMLQAPTAASGDGKERIKTGSIV